MKRQRRHSANSREMDRKTTRWPDANQSRRSRSGRSKSPKRTLSAADFLPPARAPAGARSDRLTRTAGRAPIPGLAIGRCLVGRWTVILPLCPSGALPPSRLWRDSPGIFDARRNPIPPARLLLASNIPAGGIGDLPLRVAAGGGDTAGRTGEGRASHPARSDIHHRPGTLPRAAVSRRAHITILERILTQARALPHDPHPRGWKGARQPSCLLR